MCIYNGQRFNVHEVVNYVELLKKKEAHEN